MMYVSMRSLLAYRRRIDRIGKPSGHRGINDYAWCRGAFSQQREGFRDYIRIVLLYAYVNVLCYNNPMFIDPRLCRIINTINSLCTSEPIL